MPLYRQPKSPYWWVRFSIGGVKTRRSSGTTERAAAEEFETKLRSDLWRQRKLGERPRYTWTEAVKRWAAEADHREKGRDRERLAWFESGPQDIKDLPLIEITREVIDRLRATKAAETSPSTANRHMAIVRAILRKAHFEWDWLDRIPKVPMYRIEHSEPRFLTPAQFRSLRDELPKHLKDLAEFSVETGLRMRNATHLTWDQVDLKRRLLIVPARKAKAGATLSVPLSHQALALLKRQKRLEDQPRVFLWAKGPIEDANHEAFRAARARAGVPWCRWHDLRHTWASWHVQRGTPLHVIQALGGWASLKMVQNYAHLNPEALRFHVEHGRGIPARKRHASR